MATLNNPNNAPICTIDLDAPVAYNRRTVLAFFCLGTVTGALVGTTALLNLCY